jgi:hypothetical protein
MGTAFHDGRGEYSLNNLPRNQSMETKRMEHPGFTPNLAPCDFFLFGHMKEQLKDRIFAEEEDF